MTGIAMAYEEGVFASRPAAAGRTGYVYFATDTGNLYRSNGTGWTLIGSTGGGGGGSPTGAAGGDLTGTYPNPTLAAAGPGVTGPIGTSTLIPVITIDAKGRVTALTSVASGVPTGGSVTLFDQTLAVDTATIDTGAAGVAAGYRSLEILMLLRTDEATSASTVNMTLNNDTSASYDLQRVTGINTTASAGNALAAAAWQLAVDGASSAANFFTAVWFSMPAYADTVAYKRASGQFAKGDSVAANDAISILNVTYRSTAAISRVAITPATAGKKLVTGSRMTIFGR